jgi:phosphatidate cytidylyltransferase
MKTFLTRLVSGLVGAALVISGILYSKYTYFAIIMVALIGAVHEFYGISTDARHPEGKLAPKYRRIGLIIATIAGLLSFLLNQRYVLADIGIVLPVCLFIFFVIELFTASQNPFRNIAWNVTSLVYIVIPIMLLNKLYFDKGALFVLSLLFMIWFYDSMCYISGSLFGKHKLLERVSPGKTVEGLVGGMLLSLTFIFFYDKILTSIGTTFEIQVTNYSNIEWVIIGVVTLVAATFGDLVESLLKRSVGVKDSGTIMPGHGGFLDRLDAILVAIPFAVFTIWMVDQIQNLMLVVNYLKG